MSWHEIHTAPTDGTVVRLRGGHTEPRQGLGDLSRHELACQHKDGHWRICWPVPDAFAPYIGATHWTEFPRSEQ